MKVLPRGGLGAVFPLVIMLLLAMLTLWLARTSGLGGQEGVALENVDPDYIVEKFTLIRLSDTGQPRYALSADQAIPAAPATRGSVGGGWIRAWALISCRRPGRGFAESLRECRRATENAGNDCRNPCRYR